MEEYVDGRDIEGFVESSEFVNFPSKIRPGNRINLQIYYPSGENHRARESSGHGETCPFTEHKLRQTRIMMPEPARKLAISESILLCWDWCNITKCPAYVHNKKKFS